MSTSPAQFLSRWSRLKRQGGEPVRAASVSEAATPALPDPETLVFADDFQGFLRKEVEEGVRRIALKKLFHSGQFNVMDGLDVYIDDYSIPDPIDEAAIRTLNQAREMLFGAPGEPGAEPGAEVAASDDEARGDRAGGAAIAAVAATPAVQDETHDA